MDNATKFARIVKASVVQPEGEYALNVSTHPNRVLMEIRGRAPYDTVCASVTVVPGDEVSMSDIISLIHLYNARRKAGMSKDPITPPDRSRRQYDAPQKAAQAISPELSRKLQDWMVSPQTHAEKQQEVEQAFSSLDTQVGGDHYKRLAMQPWEIIDALDLDFYDGNALKYLLRWRTKGGVEDLKKAIHYIEHQIEKYQKGELDKAKEKGNVSI